MEYFANTRKNNKQSSYLYDFIKKKIDLSEFLETEIGCTLQWYEENISAGTICPLPHHKDTKPSFRIKFMEQDGVWVYHCLAGDTKVITWDGIRPIRDLSGTTQKILTSRGKWVDAPFYSFGKQNVSEVVLSRNRQEKIIKVTPEHRWFVKWGRKRDKNKEILTKNLKIGMRLSWMFPRNKLKQVASLSPQGINHGIVFGDGTSTTTQSIVLLWGDKNKSLLKWFPLNRNGFQIRENGLSGICVQDMPFFYKKFPSLEESPCYLAGFLAGWFAADGCVAKDGTMVLNSSNKENLEYARMIAMRLGIGTYGITARYRKGIDGKMSNLYNIHFITEDFNEKFFLIDQHRDRFKNSNKKWMRRSWVVKSIRENIGEEEVFCAKVDGTHCFALEDNILIGNCLGCGSKGTIIDFCMEYYGLNNAAEAIWFLCNKFGYKESAQLVADSLKDVKKKMNLSRRMECTHIVSSNQCRVLLRKDYDKYSQWVSSAYHKMNKALDEEDIDAIEEVGFEASAKIREK